MSAKVIDPSRPFERAIEAVLRKGISDSTEEWLRSARLVYADWLDETGDYELAAAQRWMAEYGKSPGGRAIGLPAKKWLWWACNEIETLTNSGYAQIPNLLIHRMQYHKGKGKYPVAYPTRRQAERALAKALAGEQR